jgi:shikimate dehydrogenase
MMVPYAEVIGDPISHSKSPVIHKFWLTKLGLEGDFRTVHVLADGLGDYIDVRRADPLWRGCNITLPHKTAIMNHVDDPGDVRGSIGAMNTVICQPDGCLIGTNTDAAGFFAPIADFDLQDMPVAVIGTGGAAHAVLFALSKAGVGPVALFARNPLKGAAILSRFGLKGSVQSLDKMLPPAALVVNATQLGMTGQASLDLDLSALPDDAVVYDIVYAPLITPLLAAAQKRGLATVDGLEMLAGQAAVAFELFFGHPAPREHDGELRALLTS